MFSSSFPQNSVVLLYYEATRDDITFGSLREISTDRFRMKRLDQFHYSYLQNAVQYW